MALNLVSKYHVCSSSINIISNLAYFMCFCCNSEMELHANTQSSIAGDSVEVAVANNTGELTQLSVAEKTAKEIKEKNGSAQSSSIFDSAKDAMENDEGVNSSVADDAVKAEMENETNALLSAIDLQASTKAAEEYRKARQLSERRTHHEHSWDDNLDDVQIPENAAGKGASNINATPPRSYIKFTLIATLIVMPLGVVSLIFFLLWRF